MSYLKWVLQSFGGPEWDCALGKLIQTDLLLKPGRETNRSRQGWSAFRKHVIIKIVNSFAIVPDAKGCINHCVVSVFTQANLITSKHQLSIDLLSSLEQ